MHVQLLMQPFRLAEKGGQAEDDGHIDAAQREAIRKKILAASKVLTMMKTLRYPVPFVPICRPMITFLFRSEHETIMQLKALAPGQQIPRGLLAQGPEAIRQGEHSQDLLAINNVAHFAHGVQPSETSNRRRPSTSSTRLGPSPLLLSKPAGDTSLPRCSAEARPKQHLPNSCHDQRENRVTRMPAPTNRRRLVTHFLDCPTRLNICSPQRNLTPPRLVSLLSKHGGLAKANYLHL